MPKSRIVAILLLLTMIALQPSFEAGAQTPTSDVNGDGYVCRVCNDKGERTHIDNGEIANHLVFDSITSASDPDLEEGFPVQTLHLPGTYFAGALHTLVGNIDDDPSLETVVTGLAAGPLYAWDFDGSLVTGWPTQYWVAGYPALGNLSTASPGLEVVSIYFYRERLDAYTGSGTMLDNWPVVMPYPAGAGTPPALADVDGDGLDEIFVPGGSTIRGYRANGTVLPGWSGVMIGYKPRIPAIGDLDGDGDLEIVTASSSTSGEEELHAHHHTGDAVEGFPVFFQGYVYTLPVIGDVDGDGQTEIVHVAEYNAVVHIRSADGTLERTVALSGEVHYGTAPALADLDGDSTPEIIVLTSGYTTNGYAHAFRGDGSALPGWPVLLNSAGTEGGPAVGDVDGDQQPDVVIVVGGRVYVYSRNGTLHPRFPKAILPGTHVAPAIADIDLDGRNEIIVTSNYWNGHSGYYDKVWVYDLGGGPHGRIEWGQLGGNPQHRGVYPPPSTLYGMDLYVDAPLQVLAPLDSLIAVPLSYGNNGTEASISATLAITLDSQLAYVSDNSGTVPEVNGSVVTWDLPPVVYFYEREFIVYLQLPPGAEFGDHYQIVGELTSTGTDLDLVNNTCSSDIVVADQCFLPLIYGGME